MDEVNRRTKLTVIPATKLQMKEQTLALQEDVRSVAHVSGGRSPIVCH